MQTTSFAKIIFVTGALLGMGCHSDLPALPKTTSDAVSHNSTDPDVSVAPDDGLNPRTGEVPSTDKRPQDNPGRALFDGKTLAGWEATNFGGEGEVEVADGSIQLAMGYPMTGVTSIHESLPTVNYEVSLEAMRIDGTDFFCGLTFPVAESHCSLIVGGWGGTIVGLSNIDGMDAASNDTMLHMNFDNERWYRIRLRVIPGTISVWIDDKLVIDKDIQGNELAVRNEVLPSRPLGICGFQSQCAIKNILLKTVADEGSKPETESIPHVNSSSEPIKQDK